MKHGAAIRRRARRSRAGVTLLELLIVMAMTAILAGALSFALGNEVNAKNTFETREAAIDHTDTLEREITHLLQGARLSAAAASAQASTYYSSSSTTATTYFESTTDSGAGAGQGSNRITFTTTAPGIPMSALYNTNDAQDFTTEQQDMGPVGGLAEASLGTYPVGDAGGRNGLFLRIQRPSDADPTQGGMEYDLDPDVTGISFQFWDGLEWDSTWSTATNTTSAGNPALPQAVQVSYTLAGDPANTIHMFVVPIPASTITAQSPATGASTQ